MFTSTSIQWTIFFFTIFCPGRTTFVHMTKVSFSNCFVVNDEYTIDSVDPVSGKGVVGCGV